MSDGRSELEKAIEVWEQRYAAAVQAKREAEVVMPFLRAAVEELDSFHAGSKTGAATAPESAPRAPEPVALEQAAPTAFDGDFGPAVNDAADALASNEAPAELPSAFPARGIAALLSDEETDDEVATGS